MAIFTQQELTIIKTGFANIISRLSEDGLTALDPNDKPIAEGYAMMAKLLQDRKENDETLSPIETKNLENVITWFQGAEKVNRGEGAFSTMIRTYSDIQGKLHYGSVRYSPMSRPNNHKIKIELG